MTSAKMYRYAITFWKFVHSSLINILFIQHKECTVVAIKMFLLQLLFWNSNTDFPEEYDGFRLPTREFADRIFKIQIWGRFEGVLDPDDASGRSLNDSFVSVVCLRLPECHGYAENQQSDLAVCPGHGDTGWYLTPQIVGYCSSGNLSGNLYIPENHKCDQADSHW